MTPWIESPFIIAEISANHLGNLQRAFELIEAAKDAGADAVKFQAYSPDTITVDCNDPAFVVDHPLWAGRTLYELYTAAQTPFDWFPKLWAKSKEVGILPFASVFDETALTMLEGLDSALYKVASCELVDIPLIRKMAATGKPLILSTGMGSLAEIMEAVAAIRSEGNENFAVLHCVSGYPTPADEANLLTIADLEKQLQCPVGLSDHTLGITVPTAAMALGACIIEKHMTIRRSDGGPDAAFSLEPSEFREMVDAAHVARNARGRASYGVKPSEESTLPFRRSLYTVAEIKQGEVFTEDNLRSIRPAGGLMPRHLADVLGKRARRDIRQFAPLSWDDVEGER